MSLEVLLELNIMTQATKCIKREDWKSAVSRVKKIEADNWATDI
jgi:hypothetical protein